MVCIAFDVHPNLLILVRSRLHGCYLALHEGFSQDALVDFTGGIGEFIDLTGRVGVRAEDESERDNNIQRLYRRLKRLERKGCSLICSAIQAPDSTVKLRLRILALISLVSYLVIPVFNFQTPLLPVL